MAARRRWTIFSIFLVGQVLDGAFTYIGVRQFGLEVEQNALLVFYMQLFGPAVTLVCAKTLACLCGSILHFAHHHRVLAAVSGAYVGLAVVPWSLVLARLL
jgi:uncharacterized membrane protein